MKPEKYFMILMAIRNENKEEKETHERLKEENNVWYGLNANVELYTE
jgi:hypothetical protein